MDLPGILGGSGGDGSTGSSSDPSVLGALLGAEGTFLHGGSTSNSGFDISLNTFLIVTCTLYGVAVTAFVLRLYIRIFVQRHIYADDGFIVLGMILLTISLAVFIHFRKDAFLEGDLINGNLTAVLQSDILSNGLNVRRWLTASAILLWTVINAAKFSFMFFFRRLIVRLKWFTIYWWTVVFYLAAVWAWGVAAVIAPCPKLDTLISALQCITGSKAATAVEYSYAQIALDIVGDLLILAIPIKLLIKVKIRWTQKVALTTSLCLSIAMIGTTAARAAGILRKGYLDSIWILFWLFTSGSIGMILSCAAAFRALYLARQASRHQRYREGGSENSENSTSTTCFSTLRFRSNRLIGKILTSVRSSSSSSDNGRWPRPSHSSSGNSRRHMVTRTPFGYEQPGHVYTGQTYSTERTYTERTRTTNETVDEEVSENIDYSLLRARRHERTARVMRELPVPERAMLTGLRSYIRRNGRDSYGGSTIDSEFDRF